MKLTTIDLETDLRRADASAVGSRSESLVRSSETSLVKCSLLPIAGILLAIATPPATAHPDYWFFERRRWSVVTAVGILKGQVGRAISRLEALQIAARILEDAERERSECAAWEANRGVEWELDQ